MRPRGNIEQLASGSLRVRVYAGVDVLSGRKLYLKQVIPAGPDAWALAEQARAELVRQVREGRQPRTNASLAQLLDKHLQVHELELRWRQTLDGYVRKHVAPLIGDRPVGSLNAPITCPSARPIERSRCSTSVGPRGPHRPTQHRHITSAD